MANRRGLLLILSSPSESSKRFEWTPSNVWPAARSCANTVLRSQPLHSRPMSGTLTENDMSEAVVSSRAIHRMMAKWGDVLARMHADGGREAEMVALGNRAQPQQMAQQSMVGVRSR